MTSIIITRSARWRFSFSPAWRLTSASECALCSSGWPFVASTCSAAPDAPDSDCALRSVGFFPRAAAAGSGVTGVTAANADAPPALTSEDNSAIDELAHAMQEEAEEQKAENEAVDAAAAAATGEPAAAGAVAGGPKDASRDEL